MVLDKSIVWEKAKETIRSEINEKNFDTWFIRSAILEIKNNGFVCVGFHSAIAKNWVNDNYFEVVQKALKQEIPNLNIIKFDIVSKKRIKIREPQKKKISGTAELNFQYTNKSNLNINNVFENFIQTPHNMFALSAAHAVVENPGGKNSPLFLFGNVGLGKTHLMQAIGNALLQKNNRTKVLYITAEKFRDDYLASVSRGGEGIIAFKNTFYDCDVLIIDDIQFLTFYKGSSTKEQIHHIFNNLTNNNKQIIFSSDVNPRDLKQDDSSVGSVGFRPSLISRFENGITLEISPLDFESKEIILNNLIQRENIEINEHVRDHILKNCAPDIRSIESKVRLLSLYSGGKGKIMSISEFLKHVSKNEIKKKNSITYTEIITAVTNYYEISYDSVFTKSRKKEVVQTRQVIMFILREYFDYSYSDIGKKMKRDHTTVIHSCEKVKSIKLTQPTSQTSQDISNLTEKLAIPL